MKLVIVESPNKCNTIKKYLGSGYEVMASVGHLVDLSTSGYGGFGIEPDNEFKAKYVPNKAKMATIVELKRAARRAEEVILATDPDREGEAIAWHLANILDLDVDTTKRLEFHEITHDSIEHAIANPRTIDMNLVNSQEARRIIDRVIGFKVSGIINKKIKSKSAGRVQSATLKLIADHEEEIKNFKPEEYWTLSLDLTNGRNKLHANYKVGDNQKKISNAEQNNLVINHLAKDATVTNVTKTFKSSDSKPAFTTSTMMQEAITKLHMQAKDVTKCAQLLYEGVQLGNEHVGLVTYIRTDSTAISNEFAAQAKDFILKRYGKEYVGHRKIVKVNAAQGAHEAIRPTSIYRTPESLKGVLQTSLYKLYKLIYDRTIASIMTAKKDEVMTVILDCGGVKFESKGYKTLFDGYSKVYKDEDDGENYYLANINEGDKFQVNKVNNEQKFTEPPAHYNEAKIVKLMEEKGIGRPSTYASTIKTLLDPKRDYLKFEKGNILITEQGAMTSFVLNKYFPDLVNVRYTADMELDLDKIQKGESTKTKILTDFYYPFLDLCDKVAHAMYASEPTDTGRVCPKCGAPLVVKKSKYGEFVGCSNFPECDYRETQKKVEYAPGVCPKCGKPLVYRISKSRKRFIACSGFPECDYIEEKQQVRPSKEPVKKCPKCGGDLYVRVLKGKKILGCSNYPNCKHFEEYKEEK